ncbi:TonB-dependent receptor [Cereibacter changlensis]|nr:TonB-dependent receptor [Cereibacter changlensis]PZX46892.1 hemoglobin/transferrin/lactoferrin receptor protein [Cereibacter changlensis]
MAARLLGATFAVGLLALPAAAQSRDYAISAGRLSDVLAAYAAAAGVQLVYDPATLSNLASPGLSGSYTVQQGFARLLAGSGHDLQPAGSGNFILVPKGRRTSSLPADGSTLLAPLLIWRSQADDPYRTLGAVARLDGDQLERRYSGAVGDLFKGTPGVIAANNHNGSKLDVNIRGMQGQNRVKVAIDGTQQTSTTWRGYAGVDERVYLDPDLIGGIDISKGPGGGAAGAGSTGGVVAIRTLEGRDVVAEGEIQGWRLRFGSSDNATAPQDPGSFGQRDDAPGLDGRNRSGSLAYGYVGERFEMLLAAAERKRGNYFAGRHGDTTYSHDGRDYLLSFTKPGEEVFNSSEDSSTLMAKFAWTWGDAQRLSLGLTQHDTRFGESMGSLMFQQDDGFRQVKLSDLSAKTYTLRYTHAPDSPLVDLKAGVWMSDVAGTTRAVTAALGGLEQWGYVPADEPRYARTRTYGADVSNTSRFSVGGGALSLTYGASYQREDIDGDTYCSRTFERDRCVWMTPSVGTREVASLFSSTTWDFAADWRLEAGLRYDAWRLRDRSETARAGGDRRDGGRLTPTISLGHDLTPELQLFARYAMGIRPPTLRETMVSDANATPNPDLRQERSRSLEIGANFARDSAFLPGDSARLKFVWFNNRHRDYISRVTADPMPGQPVFTFANIDRAEFEGVELSGSYENRRLFAEVGANYYTDAEFCRNGDCSSGNVQTDYAANHVPPDLSLSLTAGVKLFDERLSMGLQAQHAGKRMSAPTTQDRQRTAMWQPYTVVNLFASYEFSDSARLDLRIENAADRYYVDALDGWTPAPGRTLRLGVSATF